VTDQTNDAVLSIGRAARLLGVRVAVLRRWNEEGLVDSMPLWRRRLGISAEEMQRVRARLGFRAEGD
jgi:hypothetical protein